jgi:ABC-type dipeptide/oligopeptide/nickel transport system permease component
VADADNAAELRKLVALRDRGVLTQSEYQTEEDKVLGPAVEGNAGEAESGDRPPRRRSKLAERSNFTAIVALLCAIVVWPAGIILGYQARREARQTGNGADRLALVALVIGYLAAMLTIVFIILRA